MGKVTKFQRVISKTLRVMEKKLRGRSLKIPPGPNRFNISRFGHLQSQNSPKPEIFLYGEILLQDAFLFNLTTIIFNVKAVE